MINTLAPNLKVTDVNKSVTFYRDVLGFKFILGVPMDTQNIVTSFTPAEGLAHAMVKFPHREKFYYRQSKRAVSDRHKTFLL